jgi:hypothetical protein
MINFLWPALYRYPVKALWVAWHISCLYTISVHTSLSKSRETAATTSFIVPVSSGNVVANGGMYTVSLMYPQNKKSRGIKSGEQGSQVTGLPCQSTSLETWYLRSPSPPCGNVEVLCHAGTKCHRDSTNGMRNSSSMSRYNISVKVCLANKKGPNTFCLDKTCQLCSITSYGLLFLIFSGYVD